MKLIGWIGTILCAPFYYFFCAMDKLKVTYWIPVGTGVYGVFLFIMAVKSLIEDSIKSPSNIMEEVLVWILYIFLLAIIVAIASMIWYLLFTVNNILYMLLIILLTPFVYGFTYCNAWRQGMSKYELQGKLAYIEHEKKLRKQEIKAKQEAKKAEKERKKKEQYAKGYQNQQEKRTGQ
nr:hypothetical protein [uncultured Blautia sp.]